jgi:hypothetical protein
VEPDELASAMARYAAASRAAVEALAPRVEPQPFQGRAGGLLAGARLAGGVRQAPEAVPAWAPSRWHGSKR